MDVKAFQKAVRCGMIDQGVKTLEEVRAMTGLSKPTFYRGWQNPGDFRVKELEKICEGLQIRGLL